MADILSPVYGFPSPAAGDTADAELAFNNLNNRLERETPAWHGSTNHPVGEGLMGMPFLPSYNLVYAQDTPLQVIGWADITAEIAVWAQFVGTNVGGTWRLVANGTPVMSGRWHNYAATQLIRTTLQATIAVPASLTNVNTRIEIGADTASAPAYTWFARTIVRQYGAPGTG